MKSRVAVLRTRPETVLEDYIRLFEVAGGREALAPGVTTILKDNISWHYPMPGPTPLPGNWKARFWPCGRPALPIWWPSRTRRWSSTPSRAKT